MLVSLLEKIPINLGSSFLRSGLIPVLFAWGLILLSKQELISFSQSIIKEGSEYQLTPIVIESLWILFFAGLLSGLRDYLFKFFQLFHWPVLRPIRRHLVYRQLKKKLEVDRKTELIGFNIRVAQWFKFGLYQPKSKPSYIHVPEDWYERSKNGRKALRDTLSKWDRFQVVPLKKARIIQQGLSALYLKCFENEYTSMILGEYYYWEGLLSQDKEKSCQILEIIESLHQRDLNMIFPKKECYPPANYILPTRLGNIIASVDDYGIKVFGIQTDSLWNRIWNLMTDEERSRIAVIKLDIQQYLNLTISLTLAFTVITINGLQSSYSAFRPLFAEGALKTLLKSDNMFSNDYWVVNWQLIGTLITALFLIVACISLTITSAFNFKDTIIVQTDLRKRNLLTSLGFNPKSTKEELEILQALDQSISNREPIKNIEFGE